MYFDVDFEPHSARCYTKQGATTTFFHWPEDGSLPGNFHFGLALGTNGSGLGFSAATTDGDDGRPNVTTAASIYPVAQMEVTVAGIPSSNRVVIPCFLDPLEAYWTHSITVVQEEADSAANLSAKVHGGYSLADHSYLHSDNGHSQQDSGNPSALAPWTIVIPVGEMIVDDGALTFRRTVHLGMARAGLDARGLTVGGEIGARAYTFVQMIGLNRNSILGEPSNRVPIVVPPFEIPPFQRVRAYKTGYSKEHMLLTYDDGYSELPDVSDALDGEYFVEIEAEGALLQRTTVELEEGVIVGYGDTPELIYGDVDNSGEIDGADVDLVIAAYGLTTESAEFGDWLSGTEVLASDADVDFSGEIDASDVDLAIENYGLTDD